jgi:hypothetical protein
MFIDGRRRLASGIGILSSARRRAQARRHCNHPQAEPLERRRLLTLSLQRGYSIGSYAGVGFALNPVTQISGTFNGQADDHPSDYQVKIDWGDGASSDTSTTLVAGGVNGSVGYVLVKGTHIYKQQGTYNITVSATGPDGQTVSDNTATATVSPMPDAASQPITVPKTYSGAEAPAYEALSLQRGYSIGSYVGVGFALNPVTQISGTYSGMADDKVSDYHAQINWGDSTTWDTNTSLVAGGTNGSVGYVLVKGTHIYKQQGTYDITVYVTGPDGQTVSDNTATATAVPMPDAASQPITVPAAYSGAEPLAYEALSLQRGYSIGSYVGVGFALNPVTQISGTYSGQPDDNIADYHAQINWGDSTSWDSSTSLVSGGVNGSVGYVLVKGTHIYKQQGTYDITVYVTGPDGQTVSDNTATATAVPMPAAASQPITVPTAYTGAEPLAYEALSVQRGYSIGSYAGVGFALNPVTQISGTYNGQPDDTISDYHAQINWGDSNTWDTNTMLVSGGVNGSVGYVLVKGTHIYAQKGTYSITVYVTGPDGQTISDNTATATVVPMPDTASQPITVPKAYPGAEPLAYEALSLQRGYSVGSYVGVGFALNPVTQISGTYNGMADDNVSDYHAQINWGDSTTWDTSTMLVAGGTNGSVGYVLVKGTHIYKQQGTYDVTVYVTGPDGQTVSDDTATATAVPMPDAASQPITVPTAYSGPEPLAYEALSLQRGYSVSSTAGVGFDLSPVTQISGTYNGKADAKASDYHAQINWGDSNTWDTNTTLVSGGTNGSVGYVLVKGSHSYEQQGTYDVTVYITGPDGQTISDNTATADVSPLAITPSPQTINATEGTAYSNSVASFSVNDPTAQADDFTASIDWGDGTTTTGTINANSSGGFTVDGTHTYADEMTSVPVNVTIDTATGVVVAAASIHPLTSSPNAVTVTSTANVQEADTVLFGNVMTITVVAGVPYTGLVATFTDSGYPNNMPGDFTGMIDWGDNTTTPGTVSGGNGTFMLSADKTVLHAYASTGTFMLKAMASDDKPGTTLSTGIGTAHVVNTPLAATGTTINVTEGDTFNGTVATFTSSDPTEPKGNFTAMITWDDGTTSAGTIDGGSGSFTVSGSHFYPEEKVLLPISVSIKDNVTSATATASSTANVADALLLASGPITLATVVEGNTFSGTVATFTDAYAAEPDGARDFTAMINWGDTMTSPGMITGSNGQYTVTGSHPYKDEKASYPVVVTINDDGGATATASSTITVTDAPLTASDGLPLTATEGMSFTDTVATFTDAYAAEPEGANDFTAMIDWGDTMTSAGMITGSNGQYTVTGTHTYAEETTNPRPITVTITDDGGMTATAHTTASVADAALTATGMTITPAPGTPFNGTVATFTDAYPGEPDGARDFTAMIDWGDGVTTAGTVGGSNGSYTVSGMHTYFYGCPTVIIVTITDDGGQSATAFTNVNFPGVTPLPQPPAPANPAAPALGQRTWQPVGPAPIQSGQTPGNLPVSGRITGIATSPNDPRTIFITAAGGGVWRTTDGGATWTPLTDHVTDSSGNPVQLFTGAIAIAPSNPNIIYVGTGEDNQSGDSFYGRGVLKSADGGNHWTLLDNSGQFNRRTISKVVVDPTNPDTVYIALALPGVNGVNILANANLNFGIWKSMNGGTDWTNTTFADISTALNYTDLVIDPSNPQVLYAAVGTPGGSGDNGIWKTTTGGDASTPGTAVWTQLTNGVPAGTSDGRIALAISPTVPQTLYAAIAQPNGTGGGGLNTLLVTRNGGTLWTTVPNTPNFLDYQGNYDIALAVDPMSPNFIFVAGQDGPNSVAEGILNPVSGTAAWAPLASAGAVGPHVDHHALVFNVACQLLDGNDGGLYLLSNPSTNPPVWYSLNGNLQITQFTGIALDPTSATVAYGGSQDNGTEKFTGTLAWNQTVGGDGGFVRVDPSHSSTVYHTFFYPGADTNNSNPDPNFFERSDNGGQTWTPKVSGITTTDPGEFYTPYVIDPSNPQHLLLGTNRLYTTTNRGDSWTPIAITTTAGTNTFPITAIAIAATDPQTIYVAVTNLRFPFTHGALFVTHNGGTNWTLSTIANGTHDRFTDIEVDPTNPMIAYAVRGAFNDGTNTGHLFETTDGGMTWNDVSHNLPDVPADSLLIDSRTTPARLFVGTDVGVYASTDGGNTWSSYMSGLPNVQVTSLALSTTTNILAAGTHGRGMWEIQLPATLTPPVLQFTGAQFTANITDGSTPIVLTRGGDVSATDTVVVSSPGGGTVAAFNQTVSFAPGAATATLTLPVPNDGKPGEADIHIPLTLSFPGPGVTLGGTVSADLVIHDNNPPVTVTPAVLQFASAQFTANITDGSTQVVLTRTGNLSAAVNLVVSSPGGPDVAAFQQTITFAANAATATVTLPIQNDGKPGAADVAIPLSLSSPGPGATLGAATTATLVVHDNNSFPPLVTVTSLQPTTVRITTGTGKKGKTKTVPGLLLQFSGNLSGTGNPAAYQLATGTTRKGRTTFTKNVPLTVFNATPTTVTLVPGGKLKLSQPAQLRVTAAALSDAFGRPLDGGQSFTVTFGNKVVKSASARVQIQSRVGPLSASAVDALFERRLIDAVHSARRGLGRGG